MDKRFNIHDWQAKQRRLVEQDDDPNFQKRQDRLIPGKNPDAFYGPGSPYQKLKQKFGNKSQESMSNADIGALQKVVGEYSLNKILNTIAAIADRMGKDEADMIKKLANQIQDFDPSFEPGYRGNPTDMDDDPRMDPAIRSDFDDPILEQTPTVFDDESMDELGDIISKYVEDPDDVQRELDRFDDGGFDNMSNMVIANLLRDPEYKAWYNKLHSIKENNDVRKVIRKIIKEQNFDDRLKSMMGADDFEKATNPQLGKLISNSIATIDPEMSYVDFAKGVAQVLIDEYGTHNYEPFIKELKKALDSTLG